MSAEGMISTKEKIAAAITNAQEFIKIQQEFGSFDSFVWQFVGGKTKRNAFKEMSELPAESDESNAMSKGT